MAPVAENNKGETIQSSKIIKVMILIEHNIID